MIWIETILLCSIGGITGNILALGLSELTDVLIRRLLPYSPTGKLVVIDAQLFITTIVVIIAIGIVSGIYPARKASSVRPIESIRSEVN